MASAAVWRVAPLLGILRGLSHLVFHPPTTSPAFWDPLLQLWAFQLVCSTFVRLHPRLRRPEAVAVRRAVDGWWPVTLFFAAMVGGGTAGALVVGAALSALGLREWLRMLPDPARGGASTAAIWATIPLQYGLLAGGAEPRVVFAVPLAWVYFGVPFVRLLASGARHFVGGVAGAQWGVVLTVVALGHMPAWLVSAPPGAYPRRAEQLAFVLFLVMANDAAQFVFGKALGRHPLAPRISPKKTWEGFAGGLLVVGIVAALLRPLQTDLDPAVALAIVAAVAAFGLLGDLAMSAIKRDLGEKDTGSLVPGQGGVLDRTDSMMFVAPLYVHWLGF